MSRGLNKVMLIGHLGADPEVRSLPNGQVANITLATSKAWKDKVSGENKEQTEWHRIVFFNKLADVVARYLRKGSKVYVEGSLRTRKWCDQQGVDRYTTEIVAKEMQMLDSKSSEPQQYEENATQDHQSGKSPYVDDQEHPFYTTGVNHAQAHQEV